MKKNCTIAGWLVLLALSILNLQPPTAYAQTTAFSYQGQLNANGSPATGIYDLRFTIYDAVTNGNVVSGVLTNAATPVTNGLFTVTLDFGPGVFTGPARWLELDVRTNGSGAFTPLLPRQPLLPTPYAIMANTASNLLGTVPAAQLSGSVQLAQLPGAVLTNNQTGVTLNGAFNGNGGGLTNLNASQLTSGTVPLAQLSGITSNQLAAATWQLATNLNGGNAALASNVVSGIAITNAFITNSVFAGNGGGLTNLSVPATSLTGTIPLTQLPGAVLTNNQTGVTLNGTFNGNGGGLTNLNASQLSSGVVPLVRLPAAVVTNDAANLTIGGTNAVAPLTVPPKMPAAAIGSVGTGANPWSVAVAGRYAFVVNNDVSPTLQILDVSTPSAPVSVGVAGTGTYPNSVAVAGRYAYVANAGGTLQIFDVSNPSVPVSVGSVGTGGNPSSVAVAGRYAYVVNENANTLQVFDVSLPSAPVSVGSVGTGNYPQSVAVAGRYAYVANNGSNTLQIFDVSNPSAPVSVGSVGTGNYPQSVAVAGRYAYVANNGSDTLQVFDVSNPSAPVSVGSVGTGSGPWSVAVAGRYAYVVNLGNSTLQIFDVSTPSAPVSVGSVGTDSQPISVAVAGRYAYVANDASSTLQLFDLGGAYLQQLEAGAMETGTLQTRDTVTVGNNLDVRGGLTVSASARISGGLSVDNGTITAPNFSGNGAGLTNVPANAINGGFTTNILIGGHTFYYTNGILMNVQ